MLFIGTSRVVSCAAPATGGAAIATNASTPLVVGLGSSSSSSSLDDHWEFCELVRAVEDGYQRYSDATRDVGCLERYLDTVGVALSTSKTETTAA